MLNDKEFVGHLNELSRQSRLVMPMLEEGDAPPDDFLAAWAGFLEECVKRQIKLSDPRWQRLKVAANDPCVKFTLEKDKSRPDSDFRVGLQLLVGLLEPDEED